jgi:putative phosphoesterase
LEIGVFSDIHGNARALTAVWDALVARGIADHPVLNAGDNVGNGDQPEACVAFLRAHPNIVCVQGNYDKNVARYPERHEEFARKWARSRPDKLKALADGSAAISEESRRWLARLPAEARVTIEGVRIMITHYSPGEKAGLGPWDSLGRLSVLAAKADAEVVVCGHTHAAFVREAGGVLFVNPGSAGAAHRHHPYAILSVENGRASAILEQI